MKVAKLSWTAFRLPLRSPFQTASGEISHREGLILQLTTDGGIVGLGEASPHPAEPPGTLQKLTNALAEIAPRLLGIEVERLEIDAPPAVACGETSTDLAWPTAGRRSRRCSTSPPMPALKN
ncbi:MAG: hypothetical protein IIB87_05835 [Chloroflexi bacterium]|nr:hypothetical protein [Chloroflexota bacterium]